MCLEMLLEGVQTSRRADGKWQIVPYTSCSDTKCSVADGVGSYVYVGRSARVWLTIADAVGSCCRQRPSADLYFKCSNIVGASSPVDITDSAPH